MTEPVEPRVCGYFGGARIPPGCRKLAADNAVKLAQAMQELHAIAFADWRQWSDGLDTPAEFATWAQSRARHTLAKLGDVEAQAIERDTQRAMSSSNSASSYTPTADDVGKRVSHNSASGVIELDD
jgi:hypothetical protein